MSYSLLFDIGNVIVSFDFQISVRRIASMCTVPPEQIFHKVNELKDDLESGSISSDDFLDQAMVAIGYSGEREFLVSAFQEVFDLNTEMVALIEAEADLGTPLYLLSNTNGIHVPYLFEQYPVFNRFDGAIYSHEVKCMKPGAEIFHKTVEILGVNPATTIYIDDMPENVDAGKANGFQAIRYQRENHVGFLDELCSVKQAVTNSSAC